ncbi:hypothetical protein Nocox_33570 [Nonomuraea coxensis DSM 45129]|uniref:Uncharacterized protein n=1 Tax=Nonomuraea coxensis DSM 45129 TaxID=1122611 RepID=A0ABX8U949_9ACTN|nr:hypothetical protein [Nonomuraea coxensis]QYC44284.1 hypothetical protein Nocox_33570 [Nonomuraea coxensis DSM 45129]
MSGILAHGIGSRHDLPIPAFYAFAGALAALLVSFLGLAVLWADSRFRGQEAGRALPRAVRRLADARATRVTLRALGLLVAAFTLVTALFGPDDPERNPAPTLVYVIFWVGLVPASLLLGPVWRLVNPLRAIHLALSRLAGLGRDREPPHRLGHWPAAAGLLAFTWLELVAPEPAANASLLVFFGCYATVHLAGALAYGPRWFDHCDAFEVYSALIGRLAPLGRRADGRLVLRNPFHGLDAITPAPGLVATVCVMLASTAYDGFSDAPAWVNTLQSAAAGPTVTGTLGLLAAVAGVALLYGACIAVASLIGVAPRMAGHRPRGGNLGAFAHSLVPIAVGYLIAHYFSLLVIEGQRAFILASDPLDTGLDLLGTAARTVDEGLVGPGAIASVQVVSIVAGHVLGVVAAHDRSVRLFAPARAVAGQIPLFVLMVCYTLGGLTLLLAA